MSEDRIDQRSARRSVRGMRDHAGGFVDDDDIFVFIDDWNVDRFGLDDKRGAFPDLVLDDVARA